jgi:hypothetical protein
MPISAFLDGQSFDGETVRLMGIAFEMALESLRATPDCADPIRAAVARKIIELAQGGERDPERLCEGALKSLRPAVSDPSPLQTPASLPAHPGSLNWRQSVERQWSLQHRCLHTSCCVEQLRLQAPVFAEVPGVGAAVGRQEFWQFIARVSQLI